MCVCVCVYIHYSYIIDLVGIVLISEYDKEELVVYEEVELLSPHSESFTRPIVLVGAPGVGTSTLQQRLVLSNPQEYNTPMQRK